MNGKQLPPLYFKDSNDNIRIWEVLVDGSSYWVRHGVLGGKIQETTPKVAKAKNIGKINGTTADQQAALEAERIWNEQIHDGMVKDINDAVYRADGKDFFAPMLAKTYEEAQNLPYDEGVYSNPKLDGIRLVHTAHAALSRQGKPFNTIAHITNALKPFFAKFPTAILDGELYNHDYKDSFQELQSLITKKNLSLDELMSVTDTVQYHVYDAVGIDDDTNQSFADRYAALEKHLPQNSIIKLVKATKVNNEAELNVAHEDALASGYEGQMIRLNNKYEVGKRSKFLLKRKIFNDEEFEILDIVEGEGNKAGMAASMRCVGNGVEFDSNVKANDARKIELLNNKHKYIGKMATVKYFGKFVTGIPRFPYVIKLREKDGSELPIL